MAISSTTKRPIAKVNKCNYFFLLYYNELGFYFVPGIGNTNHTFHPKKGQHNKMLPVRLLDTVKQHFLDDMANGYAADSIYAMFCLKKLVDTCPRKTSII